jgi:stearoyl-CoA desaturase (delta-9 desaturase)
MSKNRDAFKVNSLTDLDRASPVGGEVAWDSVRSIWNSAMLSAAVIFGPLTFGWSALLVFILTAGITLFAGHSVGFHRRLIHRSFDSRNGWSAPSSGLAQRSAWVGRSGP